MTAYTPIAALKPIDQLIMKKEAMICAFLNNVKVVDVRSEERFNAMKDLFKKTVLIQPVVFEEPCPLAQLSLRAPQGIGWIRDKLNGVLIKRVAFPFTGSRDLFDYLPEGETVRADAQGMVRPVGNALIVDIAKPATNWNIAIVRARSLLKLTMEFIARNNVIVSAWSDCIACELDTAMEHRKEELISIYGER